MYLASSSGSARPPTQSQIIAHFQTAFISSGRQPDCSSTASGPRIIDLYKMAATLPTRSNCFFVDLACNSMIGPRLLISFLVVLCGVGGTLTSSTNNNSALSPLPEFIHDVFAQLTSTNDTVSEAAVLRFYSPDVQATDVATSSKLNCTAFGELVQGLRTQFPQRQLTNEIFVIATPADPTNRTGAVLATHILSAVQDGQQLVVTIASLIRVNWVQDEAWDQGGRRQIVTEALIPNIVPE
ncbi:hypothetical protein DFH09DRAFT_1481849 [Mycena vulgaris]|nr:hypothetical protein DFH09DRAFT_1481849 [Mycena vulgaris]